MAIEFPCKQCGRNLRVPDDSAGRQAQCPECQATTVVPAASSGAAPSSPFGPAAPQPGPAGINPYQSPSQFGMAENASGIDTAMAANRVSGPAIALMVVAGIGMALQVLGLAMNILQVGMGAAGPGRQADGMQMMFSGGFGVVLGLVNLCVGAAVIMGAIKMKNLENYSFSLAAAILAMIPCISPCCLLGLPFGIWALVVLNDAQVKAAFRG